MSDEENTSDDQSQEGAQTHEDAQSISLDELSQSFAKLIGETKSPAVQQTSELEASDEAVYSLEDVCPTNPRTILEAMLFVGHPSNEPLSSRQAASLIRGVSPREVDSLVEDLNASYLENAAAYRVVSEGAGYRMSLLSEHQALRERFYGRIRRARLSQSAIDVLALVAYNQPITKKDIEEMRQRPSGGVLSQLVRRGLLRIERVEEEDKKRRQTLYWTTDRFLELFGLDSIDDLPRSQEMDVNVSRGQ